MIPRPSCRSAPFNMTPASRCFRENIKSNSWPETGRIGTFETAFLMPNLNKEDKRIAISSVVLSSQRVDFRDALYNAAKDKGKAESVNPLVQEGQKLIPSVTGVFSKG